MYSFDFFGWLSETPIEGRDTEVTPPSKSDIPNGFAANFTGYKWIVIPYVPPPPLEPPSIEPEARLLGQRVAGMLDLKVMERDYDDMKGAVTYALSTIPKYRSEAQACIEWRDAVWIKFYEVMNLVQAGTRPMPEFDELIAELPVLEWPS